MVGRGRLPGGPCGPGLPPSRQRARTGRPDAGAAASRSAEWEGRDAVAGAFGAWFGTASEFELVDAAVGEVGGRLHLAWRLRLRPAPFDIGTGWHVIEQQAYADASDSIDHLDLLCSGFQPERSPAGTR